jgi:hypothetical protein
MNERWEVGSEFDWSPEVIAPSTSRALLPETYELFSTGRGIFLSIRRMYSDRSRLRLHLPSFFCMEVAAKLNQAFELCWYRDLPNEPAPDFNSLQPRPGDMVLAVNLFGIRSGKVWQDWLAQQDNILLIEDHTHDPFSPWAQQSTAHYEMASLRKTLPLPDGAIVWSGCKARLPQPIESRSDGAEQKLIAMLLKRAYLSGANISKDAYRFLQVQGEEQMRGDTGNAASSFTQHILQCLDIAQLRQKRENNIRELIQLILAQNHTECIPLFTTWPTGAVPFNSILVCQNHQIRESLRQFLICQNVFATVHWQQPMEAELLTNDLSAIDLSQRVLTIPTDHRYTSKDIYQVAEKISYFFRSEHINLKSNYNKFYLQREIEGDVLPT